MGVLFRFTADFEPWLAFATCGAVGLIFSIAFLFIIKEPKLRDEVKVTVAEAII